MDGEAESEKQEEEVRHRVRPFSTIKQWTLAN